MLSSIDCGVRFVRVFANVYSLEDVVPGGSNVKENIGEFVEVDV
jgi:hypothetical protein|tara:strand:- start:2640 stop:2771 length:132 start_codon:yes stop_codon:yes gene_type:complete